MQVNKQIEGYSFQISQLKQQEQELRIKYEAELS